MNLNVSDDGMTAMLVFDKIDITHPPNIDDIHVFCNEAGLKGELLIKEYEKLKKNGIKNGSKCLIAKGGPPIKGVPESYKLSVPVLSQTADIRKLEKLEQDIPVHHSMVYQAVGFSHIVTVRSKIGEIIRKEDGAPGKDVFGREVFAEEQQSKDPIPDPESIIIDYDEGCLKAGINGIPVQLKDRWYLFPVDPGYRIEIELSPDNLTAWLNIYPDISGKFSLDNDKIKAALDAKGVVHGIEYDLAQINEMRISEHSNSPLKTIAAKGAKPVFAIPQSGKIELSLLDVPASIKKLESMADDNMAHHYFIKEKFPQLKVVKKDVVIGKVTPEQPAVPGKDVFGNEIESSKPEASKFSLDTATIKCDYEKGRVIADITGILVKDQNRVKIIPVDTNHRLELEESPDNFSASVKIYPDINNKSKIQTDEAYALLKERKIIFGVKEDVIKQLNEKVSNTDKFPLYVVIAEGEKPIDGKDAELEYLVDLQTSLKPKICEDGSVDFRNVKVIENVEKDQPLVRLIPEEKCTDGTNMLGKTVPGKDGEKMSLPKGLNTGISEKDPQILIALINGIVKREGGILNVYEGYIIKDCVDYSTGNIIYKNCVIVNGDVKSDFYISTARNVEVKGVVENACIVAGETVIIHSGFIGNGNGTIRTKADVSVKFINSQKIYCGGDIHIHNEAVHSNLFCKNTIYCYGKKNSFAGGSAFARKGMVVEVLGSPTEPKAFITLGLDYRVGPILDYLNRKSSILHNKARQLREGLEKIKILSQKMKTLSEELSKNKIKMSAGLFRIENAIKYLRKKEDSLKQRWPVMEDAGLVIKQKAYPGTTVQIGFEILYIQKETGRGIFVLEDGAVVFKSG